MAKTPNFTAKLLCTPLLVLMGLLWGLNVHAQTESGVNIPALIADAQSRDKAFAIKLRSYTFQLRQTMQELDDKDKVRNETVLVFQVFPVAKGLPIMLQLSENGKDSSPERLAKERARANREWQKQKKAASAPSDAIEAGPLSFLKTSEFSLVRTERLQDREVVVLSFKPLTDFRPSKTSEKIASNLEGELWIDVAAKVIVKLDARLAKSVTVGGLSTLFASLKPGTTVTIERTRLSDELWIMSRLEIYSLTKAALTKSSRIRQKSEMSEFKPFDKDADVLPLN